ncbi:MAG: transposase [Polyangiaceae bacterium]
MTRRHIVKEGSVWAIDRRCTQRYFLFTPDEAGRVAEAFWYCLAHASIKHGIEVHAALLMSTHIHLVVTDVRGVRPRFKAEFHRLFALCIKSIRGWPEEVFSQRKGGEHEPLTEEALVEDLAYLIANPVAALAVRHADEWPGAKTVSADIGNRVIRATRPDVYFRRTSGQWPDILELRLTMPRLLEERFGAEGARQRIAARVREKELAALGHSHASRTPFRGLQAVLRTPHTARASEHEIAGRANPRFRAAGDRQAARRKLQELRRFDTEYKRAFAEWRSGNRNAVFPHGTWWMRVHHRARCWPPP